MAIWVYKSILILFALLILFFRIPAVVNPKWFKNKWKKEIKCFSRPAVKLFLILFLLIGLMLFYILFLFIHPVLVFLSVLATVSIFAVFFLSNYKMMMDFGNIVLNQSDSWIRWTNLFSILLAVAMILVAVYL